MNEIVLMLLLGGSSLDLLKLTPPPAPQVAAAPTPMQPALAKKHTILFFTAAWCPSCVRMKTQTLPRVSLPGHDLRIIDVDANPQYLASYGFQSIPAYVVLDGFGRAYRQGVGFLDVLQFVEFLNAP